MHTTEQLNTALAGRYAIDHLAGEGGMATVYLARDVKHHRKVALKVLKPDLGAVGGVDRFLAEIQVTANMQHPNLLPLFDSGAADSLLFYVMPYIDGESLQRAKLLPIVTYAVERKVAGGRPDYWDHATLLELAVLNRAEAGAGRALSDALAAVREPWEPETTARNLRLIREAREMCGDAPAWGRTIESELTRLRA